MCRIFLVNSTLHCRRKHCLFRSGNSSFTGEKDLRFLGLCQPPCEVLSEELPTLSVSHFSHMSHSIPSRRQEDNQTCEAICLGQGQLMAGSRLLKYPPPISQPLPHVNSQGKVSKIFQYLSFGQNNVNPPLAPTVAEFCQLSHVLNIFTSSLEKDGENTNTFSSAWRHSQRE